jgi:hypothetical protein
MVCSGKRSIAYERIETLDTAKQNFEKGGT